MFTVGSLYRRSQVYEILGVPPGRRRGNWETGYTNYNGAVYVFANVGAPGRSGHDYDNRWENGILHWYAKVGSRSTHASVRFMLDPSTPVHIFTRVDNRSLFMYHGRGHAITVNDVSPVYVAWEFNTGAPIPVIAEELAQPFMEGAARMVAVNIHERNPDARLACIAHYGITCTVCGFDFSKYGEIGVGYIHVHHVTPLSTVIGEYVIDPIHDLRPVCANCHCMIHRRTPPFTIEELRRVLARPSDLNG